jgi:hypothetical protein
MAVITGGKFFLPQYTALNARTALPPPPRFDEIVDTEGLVVPPRPSLHSYEGPESFYDTCVDASELYNAVDALHFNASMIPCLLPRRDRAPVVAAASKKGSKNRGRRLEDRFPTVPAGPAGILTTIESIQTTRGASALHRHNGEFASPYVAAFRDDDEEEAGGSVSKRKRPSNATAQRFGTGMGSSNIKRSRPRPAPFGSGIAHKPDTALTLALQQDPASILTADGHVSHSVIDDACRVTDVGGDIGGALLTSSYCSYAELHTKLLRASRDVGTRCAE